MKPKKMQTNLKKLNKSQIRLTVTLDQQDLRRYLGKAEGMLGEELEIKGFRRGKMPKDLARKQIGEERIKALALEIALEHSLANSIKNDSLDVLQTSQLSIEKNSPTLLEYSIVLDIFPAVELADLNTIKVKRQEVQVGNKEIEDALEIIRNSRSVFGEKDNETTENGDRVEVDFEVKKDGHPIEGGISKKHPLVVGGRGFIPGFEDQLVGMKKGEEKSFSLMAPSDYFHKDIAGKKLDFTVKMTDVKRVIKPEIDDNFAQSLGQFGDLTELKKSIKEGLTQEKSTKENQKLRLEILDNIVQRSKIEVSENLLNQQLELMVSDFDRNLHEKGLELGLYLAKVGKTQEELKKDWVKDAEKQVKVSLILRKLAKDLDLEATQDEIDELTGEIVQSAMARDGADQADLDPVKLRESVVNRIVNEKTLKYIEIRCAV